MKTDKEQKARIYKEIGLITKELDGYTQKISRQNVLDVLDKYINHTLKEYNNIDRSTLIDMFNSSLKITNIDDIKDKNKVIFWAHMANEVSKMDAQKEMPNLNSSHFCEKVLPNIMSLNIKKNKYLLDHDDSQPLDRLEENKKLINFLNDTYQDYFKNSNPLKYMSAEDPLYEEYWGCNIRRILFLSYTIGNIENNKYNQALSYNYTSTYMLEHIKDIFEIYKNIPTKDILPKKEGTSLTSIFAEHFDLLIKRYTYHFCERPFAMQKDKLFVPSLSLDNTKILENLIGIEPILKTLVKRQENSLNNSVIDLKKLTAMMAIFTLEFNDTNKELFGRIITISKDNLDKDDIVRDFSDTFRKLRYSDQMGDNFYKIAKIQFEDKTSNNWLRYMFDVIKDAMPASEIKTILRGLIKDNGSKSGDRGLIELMSLLKVEDKKDMLIGYLLAKDHKNTELIASFLNSKDISQTYASYISSSMSKTPILKAAWEREILKNKIDEHIEISDVDRSSISKKKKI